MYRTNVVTSEYGMKVEMRRITVESVLCVVNEEFVYNLGTCDNKCRMKSSDS